MKILAFVNKDSAPAYHRIVMPLMMMEAPDIFITNDLREEHFEERQPDIFMYSRVLPDHAIDQVKALQKKYGFKICVDIDDYWHLDSHHVLYKAYQDDGFAIRQTNQLGEADLVLTTHERLADEVRDLFQSMAYHKVVYGANYHIPLVYVCPNAIPRQGQFDIQREPSDMVRLFWQGSVTHRQDIELLQRPLEALGPLSKKIKMIMGGYTKNEAEWDAMARTYTAQLKHQYKLIPGCPVTSYYENYKQADICLVPLVNSPFNRMKSNLKILEAANMGLPVIASGVHPYLGMPVAFCKNSRDWIGHIKRLVQWPKRREEEGQRLAEYCQQHFNFHKINNERKQILEYVASKIV